MDSGEIPVFSVHYQLHMLTGDYGREQLKLSKDLASLLVHNEKNRGFVGFRFFVGGISSGVASGRFG